MDFSCGLNDFSQFMKEKLDKVGKRCNFKNYDVIQPKVKVCNHEVLHLWSCFIRELFQISYFLPNCITARVKTRVCLYISLVRIGNMLLVTKMKEC